MNATTAKTKEDMRSLLKVFSVNGVKGVLVSLAEEFQAATGVPVELTFGTIGALQRKMAEGELPDVLIAMASAMAEAAGQGLIEKDGSVEVGRTGIGVAIKDGVTAPDISTSQAFRDTLLKAKSLAFSDPKTGAASGVAFAKTLDRMGIAELLKEKTVLVGGGPVGELVAQGRVELGIQQVTELMPVKGINLVGTLPVELQTVTVYQAAVTRRTAQPQVASSFVAFITSPGVAERFSKAGFGRC